MLVLFIKGYLYLIVLTIKWIVSIISSNPPYKNRNARFKMLPLNVFFSDQVWNIDINVSIWKADNVQSWLLNKNDLSISTAGKHMEIIRTNYTTKTRKNSNIFLIINQIKILRVPLFIPCVYRSGVADPVYTRWWYSLCI